DFYPEYLEPGQSSTRTINFLNNDNIPKYKVKAVNFTGELCNYLTLQASLDGIDTGYSGPLTGFEYGPVVYDSPDVWIFTLTLPADAPEPSQGQTCDFNFSFFGSQTKNNLEFGLGFNDTEEDISSVASKVCFNVQTRSKGYWKNHPSAYSGYLPLYLGNELIDNEVQVETILNSDYNLSMYNKLRGQLLTMKFNAAVFNVGDYFVESQGKTIQQIIDEADGLLTESPVPSDQILETMKNILESLVDVQIKGCTLSAPEELVDEPVDEPEPEPEPELFMIGGMFLSAPLNIEEPEILEIETPSIEEPVIPLILDVVTPSEEPIIEEPPVILLDVETPSYE
ncbi:MAG: hypothetical protein PHW43_09660, partial [Syntrophales bacterium]|nr:hypothetical protein [Syntrophales bacterium]